MPITLTAARPIDEAISSAGGVLFEAMTEQLMLESLPGVFCAGEMLDWEAPTGGYLLTACLASGFCAGQGVLAFLSKNKFPGIFRLNGALNFEAISGRVADERKAASIKSGPCKLNVHNYEFSFITTGDNP